MFSISHVYYFTRRVGNRETIKEERVRERERDSTLTVGQKCSPILPWFDDRIVQAQITSLLHLVGGGGVLCCIK